MNCAVYQRRSDLLLLRLENNGIEVRMGAQWFDELQLVEVCTIYSGFQMSVPSG